MKLLAFLLAMSLAGCAVRQTPATYEQVSAVKLSSKDCPNIDYIIANLETQLRIKGLINANPEDLNDDDRKYNATARVAIWSLRIGCNNPGRYK